MAHEFDADIPAVPAVDAEAVSPTPISVEVVAPTVVTAAVVAPGVVSAAVVPVTPISADTPAVTPISTDIPVVPVITKEIIVPRTSFVGDAVTLFLRQKPETVVNTSFQTVFSETIAADNLAAGRWFECSISGTIDSGSPGSINFTLGWGGQFFTFAVPVSAGVALGGGGYFDVHFKITPSSDTQQTWRCEGTANWDVPGSPDGAGEQVTEARTFHTFGVNATVDQLMQFGIQMIGGAATGTLKHITIYQYDEETSAQATAGLTAEDRAKLDSVEWGAEANKPTHRQLWSFAAGSGGEAISVQPPNGDVWTSIKTGLVPRLNFNHGGLIEFMATGTAIQNGGLPGGVANQIQFRILANKPGEPGIPIISSLGGDLQIQSSQSMASFSDFALHVLWFSGTITGSSMSHPSGLAAGRQRLSALFTYLNPSVQFVRDNFFAGTFVGFFRDTLPDANGVAPQGLELTLQIRTNDPTNRVDVDGSWAEIRTPQVPYGISNLYHPA